MFSGIIEELGRVTGISHRGSIILLEICAFKIYEGVKIGESISVNGACLTVIKASNNLLVFEAMPETVQTTNLGSLKISEKVNLERSLKVGDRISGHFVSGHVDCLGVIRKKTISSGNLAFEIAVPLKYLKYCLTKGSVSVDGISLTISEKRASSIFVYIIPHTLKNTTLAFKGPSSKVNIEFDMLVKSNQK